MNEPLTSRAPSPSRSRGWYAGRAADAAQAAAVAVLVVRVRAVAGLVGRAGPVDGFGGGGTVLPGALGFGDHLGGVHAGGGVVGEVETRFGVEGELVALVDTAGGEHADAVEVDRAAGVDRACDHGLGQVDRGEHDIGFDDPLGLAGCRADRVEQVAVTAGPVADGDRGDPRLPAGPAAHLRRGGVRRVPRVGGAARIAADVPGAVGPQVADRLRDPGFRGREGGPGLAGLARSPHVPYGDRGPRRGQRGEQRDEAHREDHRRAAVVGSACAGQPRQHDIPVVVGRIVVGRTWWRFAGGPGTAAGPTGAAGVIGGPRRGSWRRRWPRSPRRRGPRHVGAWSAG
jgi:hypothetical protein